ncbi:MAG: hypothetical protein WCG25_03720 [bacterium]
MISSSIALSLSVSISFVDKYIMFHFILSIIISQLILNSFQTGVTLIGKLISFVIHLIVRSPTTVYQSGFFVNSLDTNTHVGNFAVSKKSALLRCLTNVAFIPESGILPTVKLIKFKVS